MVYIVADLVIRLNKIDIELSHLKLCFAIHKMDSSKLF